MWCCSATVSLQHNKRDGQHQSTEAELVLWLYDLLWKNPPFRSLDIAKDEGGKKGKWA